MKTSWVESEFRTALEAYRATGDEGAAATLMEMWEGLAYYISLTLKMKSYDLEDAIRNAVCRCLEYQKRYDPDMGTGFNYFARICQSQLCTESAKAAKRCQIMDALTLHPPPESHDNTALDSASAGDLSSRIESLSGNAAIVARAVMHLGCVRGGRPQPGLIARRTGLPREVVCEALREVAVVLLPCREKRHGIFNLN